MKMRLFLLEGMAVLNASPLAPLSLSWDEVAFVFSRAPLQCGDQRVCVQSVR